MARAQREASADEMKERGFSGPVRTNDGVSLALSHCKFDAPDDRSDAKAFVKINEFQGGCVRHDQRTAAVIVERLFEADPSTFALAGGLGLESSGTERVTTLASVHAVATMGQVRRNTK